MSKAAMGACILFCGHKGTFIADIHEVGNVNVVVGPNFGSTSEFIEKLERDALSRVTHELLDFPKAGFWRPAIGVFVVPRSQVREKKDVLPARPARKP
jgi:hypothetical protein